jgi:CxxC motif-containing protein (DUF1111 family)
VVAFTDFMTFLAPPPRGAITSEAIAGRVVFYRIGCASCHLPTLVTGPNKVRALNQVRFEPFSDFLLHDMGSLGDGIEQGPAGQRQMRMCGEATRACVGSGRSPLPSRGGDHHAHQVRSR